MLPLALSTSPLAIAKIMVAILSALALLTLLVLLPLLVDCQLPPALQSERDALIVHYALKGVYTAAKIRAVLAAAHGFFLR